MNDKRLELVNELIRAQSCAEAGNALHSIRVRVNWRMLVNTSCI